MPSGQVHNAVTCALAGLVMAGAVAAPEQRADLVAVAIGVTTGFFLTPDLDLAAGSIALSNVRKAPVMVSRMLLVGRSPSVRRLAQALGWLLSLAWHGIWWPYGVALKHRSALSHAPILSTALRVIYLILVTCPLWGCAASSRLYVTAQGWKYAALVFAGLCVSDAAHWAMDKAETSAKAKRARIGFQKRVTVRRLK